MPLSPDPPVSPSGYPPLPPYWAGLSSFAPLVTDIDGDGVLDLVLGTSESGLRFFEGQSDASTPAQLLTSFVERTGAANPFGGAPVGGDAMPAAVLVGGALHFIVGNRLGNLTYLRPVSSGGSTRYVAAGAGEDPFSSVTVPAASAPFSADLNGDALPDVVVGQLDGRLSFFPNAGTASRPLFEGGGSLSVCQAGTRVPCLLSGAGQPLDVGRASAPNFADADGDGDLDLWVGTAEGAVLYYENVGSPRAPEFTRRYGEGFPLSTIALSGYSHPFVLDLDADGDLDMLAGASDGQLHDFFSSFFSSGGAGALPTVASALFAWLDQRVGVRLQLPFALSPEAVPIGSPQRTVFERGFEAALRLALSLTQQGLDTDVVQTAAGSLIVTFDIFVVDRTLGGSPLESAEELACLLAQPHAGVLQKTEVGSALMPDGILMRVLAVTGELVPIECPPPPPDYWWVAVAAAGAALFCCICVIFPLCCGELISRGFWGRRAQLYFTHSNERVPPLYLPKEQREVIRRQLYHADELDAYPKRSAGKGGAPTAELRLHQAPVPITRGWHAGNDPRGRHCWENSAGAQAMVVALSDDVPLPHGAEALVLNTESSASTQTPRSPGRRGVFVEPRSRKHGSRPWTHVDEGARWWSCAVTAAPQGGAHQTIELGAEARESASKPPAAAPVAPSINIGIGALGVLQMRKWRRRPYATTAAGAGVAESPRPPLALESGARPPPRSPQALPRIPRPSPQRNSTPKALSTGGLSI